jgi:Ca2+-binding RTX toxin-like protein
MNTITTQTQTTSSTQNNNWFNNLTKWVTDAYETPLGQTMTDIIMTLGSNYLQSNYGNIPLLGQAVLLVGKYLLNSGGKLPLDKNVFLSFLVDNLILSNAEIKFIDLAWDSMVKWTPEIWDSVSKWTPEIWNNVTKLAPEIWNNATEWSAETLRQLSDNTSVINIQPATNSAFNFNPFIANSVESFVQGSDGEDVINGEGMSEDIKTFGGKDLVYGMSGNENIDGGTEDDQLYGNQGNDLIRGGDGNDSIFGGKDQDSLEGNSGSDLLLGNNSNDYLNGGTENDTIYGGKDHDLIWGDRGADQLYGDLGNDTLIGGNDRDTLTGGDGNDLFVLELGQSDDIILDFTPGKDLLALPNNLTFAQLKISASNNNTLIQLASNGELLATLNGVNSTSINSNSFAII